MLVPLLYIVEYDYIVNYDIFKVLPIKFIFSDSLLKQKWQMEAMRRTNLESLMIHVNKNMLFHIHKNLIFCASC
ncbi:hypothetical protein BB14905_18095 [Bacillus sp. B14905]|nr:hypothetical protein BB14905_18095 [Bacillus sp. B14905]